MAIEKSFGAEAANTEESFELSAARGKAEKILKGLQLPEGSFVFVDGPTGVYRALTQERLAENLSTFMEANPHQEIVRLNSDNHEQVVEVLAHALLKEEALKNTGEQ